jgi:UDP-N-acetylglucosamine 2-epimerase (non-hydrolysing)
VSARVKVLSVVGARPNFVKTLPVIREMAERPNEFTSVFLHTGQHHDFAMSGAFLRALGEVRPHHDLRVGSGSHAVQTARVMERMEPVLSREQPDVVLVSGDVNSTLAAALAASKLRIPVAHLEAGLRSFDRSMPEEINRVVVDQLAELLFIHSPGARDNLVREGRPEETIHLVGNTMIDSLVRMRAAIEAFDPTRHGLRPGEYLLVTLHRPSLVDGPLLAEAIDALAGLASRWTVVFPAHPRTRRALERGGRESGAGALRMLPPLDYVEFLGLMRGAAAVLTDSGGVQEETTYLGVPCFTLRSTTERPITCEQGTNTLLGLDVGRIAELPALVDRRPSRAPTRPPLWDGRAARRVVDVLAEWRGQRPATSRTRRSNRAATAPAS